MWDWLKTIGAGALDALAEVTDAGSGVLAMGLYAVSGDPQMMGIATTLSDKSKEIEQNRISKGEALADATPVVGDVKAVVEAGVKAAEGDVTSGAMLLGGVAVERVAKKIPGLGNIIAKFGKKSDGVPPEGGGGGDAWHLPGHLPDNAPVVRGGTNKPEQWLVVQG